MKNHSIDLLDADEFRLYKQLYNKLVTPTDELTSLQCECLLEERAFLVSRCGEPKKVVGKLYGLEAFRYAEANDSVCVHFDNADEESVIAHLGRELTEQERDELWDCWTESDVSEAIAKYGPHCLSIVSCVEDLTAERRVLRYFLNSLINDGYIGIGLYGLSDDAEFCADGSDYLLGVLNALVEKGKLEKVPASWLYDDDKERGFAFTLKRPLRETLNGLLSAELTSELARRYLDDLEGGHRWYGEKPQTAKDFMLSLGLGFLRGGLPGVVASGLQAALDPAAIEQAIEERKRPSIELNGEH